MDFHLWSLVSTPVALILCSSQLSAEVTKDSKDAVAESQLENLRLCPLAL